MLEEGKVYLVKTARGSVWLFKKYLGRDFRNKIKGEYITLIKKEYDNK